MTAETLTGVEVVDLASTPLRELNQRLHDVAGDRPEPARWRILNPNGAHAVACGLDAPIDVEISGHAGYYCAGMNKHAAVRVAGNAGTGVHATTTGFGAVVVGSNDVGPIGNVLGTGGAGSYSVYLHPALSILVTVPVAGMVAV